MNNCKKLIASTKPRSWASSQIEQLGSISDKTQLQQFQLCSMYETLTHVPFLDTPNKIYKLCENCKLKVSPDIAFQLICDENNIPKVTQQAK